MPRGKKSGRGTPRGGGGGGGGRGARGSTRGRGNHGNTLPAVWQQAGFTLMEAARETSRHDHKAWDMNSLRTKPVAFVSAGNSEPLKQLEDLLGHEDADAVTESATAEGSPLPMTMPAAPDTTSKPENDEIPDRSEGGKQHTQERQRSMESAARASPARFFFDVNKGTHEHSASAHNSAHDSAHDSAHNLAQEPVTDDRPSSRQSDSSDEVILFKGRDSRPPAPPQEQISMTHMRQEITVMESQMETQVHATTQDVIDIPGGNRKSRRRGHQRDQRPPKRSNSDDDALIADYIENMRENCEEDMMLQMLRNQQDIGGSDFIPSPDESEAEVDNKNKPTQRKDAAKREDAAQGQSNEPGPETANDQYLSGSELDDETLARLLAGHELGQNPNPFPDMVSSDSDSSDEPERWVDDLDVMDWDRPSLHQKKGKAARGRIQFNVSDSEMEQTLQAAWKNDRFKKADRKRQREEMRALGQLGKNAKPDDLRVKYPAGMSLEQVADEMRVFLQGTSETLALPPMDKHARKMIHDLANKFNIKSKSIGNADTRRPTLYRTKRTQQYSAASFDQAVNRMNRRYFPRLDARRGQGAPRTVGFGRTSMAAATVQDGEIVGATAPELGIENRGRTMLEKMGWSKGTALGATDNKGILQPVSHAMKRSKAGLG